MSRLIDLDELTRVLGITAFDCYKCEWGKSGYCTRGGDFEDACIAIEDAPIIEPERPTGRWIDNACSKCGYGVEPWNNTRYCPNCGAKMEVEHES